MNQRKYIFPYQLDLISSRQNKWSQRSSPYIVCPGEWRPASGKNHHRHTKHNTQIHTVEKQQKWEMKMSARRGKDMLIKNKSTINAGRGIAIFPPPPQLSSARHAKWGFFFFNAHQGVEAGGVNWQLLRWARQKLDIVRFSPSCSKVLKVQKVLPGFDPSSGENNEWTQEWWWFYVKKARFQPA